MGAFHTEDILNRKRHASQQAWVFSGRYLPVHLFRLEARPIKCQGDIGMDFHAVCIRDRAGIQAPQPAFNALDAAQTESRTSTAEFSLRRISAAISYAERSHKAMSYSSSVWWDSGTTI